MIRRSTTPRETVDGRELISASHQARTCCKRGWATFLVSQAHSRARKPMQGRKGYPPGDITAEWVLASFEAYPFCHYLLVPLDPFSPLKQNPWAPSLDRIDNSKGYTKDNVRITSWFWNRMRGIASIEETMENLRIVQLSLLA